ncbi:hypothetical protein GCM10022198_00310 [Klugiella xanthotipulae]|uniref:hypothetical protein n=1 Tax=Klugiella xanthotipulae TaxID=244735 RepID=UPI00115244A3|nr:hypothetical protein [Klugiella xanthotipulae]
MPWKPLDGDKFPTLGFHVADQMTEFLVTPNAGDGEPTPFMPTREQLEFLVRLYQLDPITGARVKHRGVLKRPRGWGKSPFVGGVMISEALFEVVPDGWDADGQPVAKPWSAVRTPLVLVTATTEEQTTNTWHPLLEMLRGGSAADYFDCDPMDSFVALSSGGRIEPRTSAARSVISKGCAYRRRIPRPDRGMGARQWRRPVRPDASQQRHEAGRHHNRDA